MGTQRWDKQHGDQQNGDKQRVVLVRHTDEPGDDRVERYFSANNCQIETYRPYLGQALPRVDDSIAAAVVFGGPFCVDQQAKSPFLADENDLIEGCLKAEIPFLGICQGAQQLARVLGAYAGPPNDLVPAEGHEFGYYALTARPAGRELFKDGLVVPQAHFHTFEIPKGAEHLASSARYANQAFRYGSAYAFQFHAEITKPGFQRWQERLGPIHYGQEGAQTRAQQDSLLDQHDEAIDAWFTGFLNQHFGAVLSAPL